MCVARLETTAATPITTKQVTAEAARSWTAPFVRSANYPDIRGSDSDCVDHAPPGIPVGSDHDRDIEEIGSNGGSTVVEGKNIDQKRNNCRVDDYKEPEIDETFFAFRKQGSLLQLHVRPVLRSLC